MVTGAQAFQSAWVVPRGAGMTLTALRALWRISFDDAHVIAQQPRLNGRREWGVRGERAASGW